LNGIRKPQDNPKPEGTFKKIEPSKLGTGHRADIIKHPDNLKFEEDFDRPQTIKYSQPKTAYVYKQSEDMTTLSSSEDQSHQVSVQRKSAQSSSSIQQQQHHTR
jgi:hypothetical protein